MMSLRTNTGSCFHDEVMKCRDEHERNTPWPRPLGVLSFRLIKNYYKRMHTQVTVIK